MQLACKIVDQRTESTHHWKPAEASLKQNQPLAVRTRLDKQRLETQARVIREIQILSKLSHVRESNPPLSQGYSQGTAKYCYAPQGFSITPHTVSLRRYRLIKPI
jgi:hypothetical protein